jgi:uncharacterized protein
MAQEWQVAVREAARRAAEEELGTNGGRETRAFNYRWEHVQAVVTLALRLAELTRADREVVEAAAWLHDVAKAQGENHPQLGAAFARDFLPRTDFPAAKIESVAQTIADHKRLWLDAPLERLESQVLWDADKLTKLGLTAAFQFTGMFMDQEGTSTGEELMAAASDTAWQPRTVASMHTAPARRAAAARIMAYQEYWAGLAAELRGDDLVDEQG